MNYLPPPTTDVDNPTPVLREIHRLARGYSRVFAQARFAERLSRPNPVRRVGFDMRLDVVESVEAVDGVRLITLARPCLLYTSPSPRDLSTSRMPSSA